MLSNVSVSHAFPEKSRGIQTKRVIIQSDYALYHVLKETKRGQSEEKYNQIHGEKKNLCCITYIGGGVRDRTRVGSDTGRLCVY
jgi:hypothetical protein